MWCLIHLFFFPLTHPMYELFFLNVPNLSVLAFISVILVTLPQSFTWVITLGSKLFSSLLIWSSLIHFHKLLGPLFRMLVLLWLLSFLKHINGSSSLLRIKSKMLLRPSSHFFFFCTLALFTSACFIYLTIQSHWISFNLLKMP